jgi:hypothetical protein
MKNLFLLLLLGIAFIIAASSCSSSHKVQGKNINGNWTLRSVNVEGATVTPNTKITLFDDVSYNCFQGSAWNLPANGNGSYSIAQGTDCSAGDRSIVWSISKVNDVDYLQFKRVAGGVKAKTVDVGYKMEVNTVTDSTMTLRAPLDVNGRTGYLVYRFAKA